MLTPKTKTMQTVRELVKEYYPTARPVSINNGKYYEIWADNSYLGQGKSKTAAWKAAYNNNIR